MKASRVFVLLFVSLVFAVQFVSASYLPYQLSFAVQEAILTVQETLRPVLEILIGGYSSEQFFFVKVLLLVLLFVVCRYALQNIPKLGEQKGVVITISAIVSLFAVRFLQDNDLINGILLPYGTLGIALAAILPFIIYFFFVEKSISHTSGRRLAWIFYLVVFGVLWFSRSGDLSPLGNQIYLWTFVAGMIAVVFDRGIHNYFGFNEDRKHRKDVFDQQIATIDTHLAQLYSNPYPTPEVKAAIKSYEERRKELKKNR